MSFNYFKFCIFIVFVILIIKICLILLFTKNLSADSYKFPPNFKFGIATASYQIEGGWNSDGKGENIWDNLVHKTNLVVDNSTGDVACDSYHKFNTDLALIKNLEVDFYRLSLSWARILPTGYTNTINKAGVNYYNNLLEKLQDNGIEAMVTLYHWDMPQRLLDDFGGVLNESFVEAFADYAQLAFQLFGDKVKYWLTFNEPLIICQSGYESGIKAPAITKAPGVDLYICGHNILKAHAKAYRIYNQKYKNKQKGRISIALLSHWYEPQKEDPKDQEAAERTLQFYFGWFANPIIYGNYPQVMIDRIAARSIKEGFRKSRLPKFTKEEIEEIKETYDFIALNHYTTHLVNWIEDMEIGTPNSYKDLSVKRYFDESWEDAASDWLKVVPWGIKKIVNWIKNTYNNPEIIITENGYSDFGDNLDDSRRITFFREYLRNVLEAIYKDHVNITGYTAWNLMDNFEWLDGFTVKFGLYSVNFSDPERPRTPKSSVNFYKNVIKTKCLIDKCF